MNSIDIKIQSVQKQHCMIHDLPFMKIIRFMSVIRFSMRLLIKLLCHFERKPSLYSKCAMIEPQHMSAIQYTIEFCQVKIE